MNWYKVKTRYANDAATGVCWHDAIKAACAAEAMREARERMFEELEAGTVITEQEATPRIDMWS